MLPLTVVETGKPFEIMKIGGNEETRRHLEAMGFVVGASVTVISEAAGNLIVCVKESRVGVGKNLAAKIMVQSA